MKTAHIAQPRLCRHCHAEAMALAECRRGEVIVKCCQHCRTVGVGFTENGSVRSWDLRGPALTLPALHTLLAATVAALESQDMKAAPIASN